MNKLPAELHLVNGSKGMNQGGLLPESMRGRIPVAEWMNNPDAWDKEKFINETAEFMFTVYGLGSDQDRHTLTMLADHIETYIECNKFISQQGLVVEFNEGKTLGANPYVTIRKQTISLILQLMNEMGLTPRSRFAQTKTENDSPASKFLRGVKGYQ
jgi:P27 family predicted phage terminase small subunit